MVLMLTLMTGGSGSGDGDILISKIDWVPTTSKILLIDIRYTCLVFMCL